MVPNAQGGIIKLQFYCKKLTRSGMNGVRAGVWWQHAHLINEVTVLCCEVGKGLDKTHSFAH